MHMTGLPSETLWATEVEEEEEEERERARASDWGGGPLYAHLKGSD